MNKNDFKNPLIQSGAILLLVFLLISIVASSGSQGIWGSIGALVSGLLSGVIFIVALCIAIVFSIAVIIGLYIAAVSIYSGDKGRDLFEQLKGSLCAFYDKARGTKIKAGFTAPKPAESEPVPQAAPAATLSVEPSPVTHSVEPSPVKQSVDPTPAEQSPVKQPVAEPVTEPVAEPVAEPVTYDLSALEQKIDSLNGKLSELAQSSSINAEGISALQQRIDELSDNAAGEGKLAAIEETGQSLSGQLQDIGAQVQASSTALDQLEQKFGEEINGIKEELAALHDKTSVPEVVSGILSYIDSAEDRDKITDKAKEAISRGMTYSQIDDFFKTSLSSEVYNELAAHPRLTKDFLRSIKKKF